MEKLLELLLRRGVIPLCSGGAACCFGLYSAQITHGADLWLASIANVSEVQMTETDKRLYQESVDNYAFQLRQHSGACVVLSLTSFAIAREGYLDWQQYSKASSWEKLALTLSRRQQPLPFFLRSTVLLIAAASLAMTHRLYGGWKWWQPESPVVFNNQKT